MFDLLADPSTHPAIDGTGWVRPPIDPALLTEVGQIFRMGMYHENHPNKHYEMANRVEVLDRPHAIAWQPGAEPKDIPGYQGPPDAGIDYGGWTWRYDLVPAGSGTAVTLTYDWSNVSPHHRDIEFRRSRRAIWRTRCATWRHLPSKPSAWASLAQHEIGCAPSPCTCR